MSVVLSQPHDRATLTSLGAISSLTARDVASAVAATGARYVHFASFFLLPSLAADLPPLLDELRRANVAASLDTNWDPAEKWAGLDDVLPRLDILIPNRAELRAIARSVCGDIDDDHQAAALALAKLGPRVVVKSGASGGWSVDAGGCLTHVPALDVEVVDTTGAGDSFDAGYVAALASGVDDELTRLRWATTCGSLSTRRPGGTAAQATPAELREHLGNDITTNKHGEPDQ